MVDECNAQVIYPAVCVQLCIEDGPYAFESHCHRPIFRRLLDGLSFRYLHSMYMYNTLSWFEMSWDCPLSMHAPATGNLQYILENHPLLIIFQEGQVKIPSNNEVAQCIFEVFVILKILTDSDLCIFSMSWRISDG